MITESAFVDNLIAVGALDANDSIAVYSSIAGSDYDGSSYAFVVEDGTVKFDVDTKNATHNHWAQIKSLVTDKIVVIRVTGGEPSINPQFVDFLKYCVEKLLEVQKYLPKSSLVKKDISILLEDFSNDELFRNDKKMLKLLDNFQLGLINVDKAINDRFFN